MVCQTEKTDFHLHFIGASFTILCPLYCPFLIEPSLWCFSFFIYFHEKKNQCTLDSQRGHNSVVGCFRVAGHRLTEQIRCEYLVL